jgi:hypothetical protein
MELNGLEKKNKFIIGTKAENLMIYMVLILLFLEIGMKIYNFVKDCQKRISIKE